VLSAEYHCDHGDRVDLNGADLQLVNMVVLVAKVIPLRNRGTLITPTFLLSCNTLFAFIAQTFQNFFLVLDFMIKGM